MNISDLSEDAIERLKDNAMLEKLLSTVWAAKMWLKAADTYSDFKELSDDLVHKQRYKEYYCDRREKLRAAIKDMEA